MKRYLKNASKPLKERLKELEGDDFTSAVQELQMMRALASTSLEILTVAEQSADPDKKHRASKLVSDTMKDIIDATGRVVDIESKINGRLTTKAVIRLLEKMSEIMKNNGVPEPTVAKILDEAKELEVDGNEGAQQIHITLD